MATRSCPTCGTQYVATVRRCIDCDASLVDDVAVTDDADASRSSTQPEARGRQLTYALEGWGNQLKVTLEGMLDRAGIARVWEAGVLVIPAVHEAAVDRLIATLEGGEVTDIGDDLPRVALEIEGLDADRQADLDAKLIASGLAYAWDDEGDLVVLEDDEDAVLVIIDDVLDDDTGDDDGDPLAGQAALSDLFVAVDRLVKKPGDLDLAAPVSEAVERMAGLAVPYGFSGDAWKELVAEARGLVRLIDPGRDADPSDGHEPADAADEAEATDDRPDGDLGDDGDGDDADADAREGDEGDERDGEAGQDRAERVGRSARALRDQLADLV